MKKQSCIVLFSFCFKQQNEIMLQQRASQNTIRLCYGPIHVAVTARRNNIQAGSRRLFENGF
jgi:hypothetical protein